MKKNKYAIIDDVRELNCELIAKTGVDGIRMMIEHFDEVECLCLDHDLGDPGEMNGFEVLQSLLLRNLVPDHVQLVTSNPVGRQRMQNELLSRNYTTLDGIDFYKKI